MRTDTQPTIANSPPPRTHERPSRSWLWPGVGVAAVGLVAGFVLWLFAIVRSRQV